MKTHRTHSVSPSPDYWFGKYLYHKNPDLFVGGLLLAMLVFGIPAAIRKNRAQRKAAQDKADARLLAEWKRHRGEWNP